MTMITPSYLGETIEYSSLHACRSTLEDPTEDLPENDTGARWCVLKHPLTISFGFKWTTLISSLGREPN